MPKVITMSVALMACVSMPVRSMAVSSQRRLHLEFVPMKVHEAIIKQGYMSAKKQVQGGALSGTVSELYGEIIEKGYQGFFDTNPAIEQRTLQILDLFTHPVPADKPDIKAAVDAFDAAAADPHNLALWVNEFTLFSRAMIAMVNGLAVPGFKPHAETLQRIILNNGIYLTPEERIEVAAHMVAVTGRFSQRYTIMGEEMFAIFMQAAAQALSTLPKPE